MNLLQIKLKNGIPKSTSERTVFQDFENVSAKSMIQRLCSYYRLLIENPFSAFRVDQIT